MTLRSKAARMLAPRVGHLAPGRTTAAVERALELAVSGTGKLPSAAHSAEGAVDESERDDLANGTLSEQSRRDAAEALVSSHGRLAAVEGFVTSIGGLASAAAGIPAGVAGLALIDLHLCAAIAHLGGHDVDDPHVRDAVLACLLGPGLVGRLVTDGALPGPPRALATRTGPADTDLRRRLATEVADALVASGTGGSAARMIGRRIPLLGGVVGAGSDIKALRATAAYAASELL